VVYRDVTRQAKGLYRLKHVGALGSFVTVHVLAMLEIYFVSVNYVFVSIKLMCVCVKLLKI
jgi:hypothetical protein